MFWKVELLKDGSISSVEPCEAKGRNGTDVIYVEADTKPEACSQAKRWWQLKKDRTLRSTRNRAERAKSMGKCSACMRLPSRPGRMTCVACAERKAQRAREVRAGAEVKKPMPRDRAWESWKQHKEASRQRRGGPKGMFLRGVLRRFDEMGPEAFREWVVSELMRIDQDFAAAHKTSSEDESAYPQAAE